MECILDDYFSIWRAERCKSAKSAKSADLIPSGSSQAGRSGGTVALSGIKV